MQNGIHDSADILSTFELVALQHSVFCIALTRRGVTCRDIGVIPFRAKYWYRWPMPIPSGEVQSIDTTKGLIHRWQEVTQEFFRVSDHDPHRSINVRFDENSILSIENTFSIPQKDINKQLTPAYIEVTWIDRHTSKPVRTAVYDMTMGEAKKHCSVYTDGELIRNKIEVQVHIEATL